MAQSTIRFDVDSLPLQMALNELLELAKRRPEVVQSFLGGGEAAGELVCLDRDRGLAAGAGDCRIVLEPSNCFAEFLLANRAGQRDGM